MMLEEIVHPGHSSQLLACYFLHPENQFRKSLTQLVAAKILMMPLQLPIFRMKQEKQASKHPSQQMKMLIVEVCFQTAVVKAWTLVGNQYK